MTDRLPSALPLAALVAVSAALGLIFLWAPTEAVQGDVQRILYVHVPAAWLAYLAFAVVAVASVLVVASGPERWDRVAASAAEVGVLFTTIVLVTGSIWARPTWGVWWVWDARLTTTLVLWAVYVGYLLFRSLTPPGARRARVAAVIGIIGAIDIPIVHFAVTWWNTAHPEPTVISRAGPQLTSEMLTTLLVSLAAFALVFACLLALRVAQMSARERLDVLEAHV
ncbi:MAG TPA: cytochrome c biogenesis protein CcsA [Actinomycetota bacterium]|nr:cytochrome c biogenesis protein CcsA [Actinomycetota bacterium]